MEHIKDYVAIFNAILVAIVSILGILTKFSDFSLIPKNKRKIQDLSNYKESTSLCSPDFKDEFIQNDADEKYFYFSTGIETKHDLINKLIQLKNKLDKSYKWKTIKEILPYISFDNEKAFIKLTKTHKTINSVSFALMIIFSSISVCFQIITVFFSKNMPAPTIILYLTIAFFGWIIAFLFFKLYNSYLIAKKVQTTLNELQNEKKREQPTTSRNHNS